jgi:uncharacterized membrane protein
MQLPVDWSQIGVGSYVKVEGGLIMIGPLPDSEPSHAMTAWILEGLPT